jgi:DNA-binding GntR family transcriptional regulator
MAEPLYANVVKLPPKLSLSSSVREQLIRLIVIGTLKPGDRINEVQIAISLGVSRGPVREAARELEGQGLLVSRPNQGFYVATFSGRDIIDLYEVRDWIESAIVHDIAKYGSPEIIRTILGDVDLIDCSSQIAFSESLFAHRVRMIDHIHNRLLAEQALALYRKFLLVIAVIDVADANERMVRIVGYLRNFWTLVGSGEHSAAITLLRAENKHWCANVATRFPAESGRPIAS